MLFGPGDNPGPNSELQNYQLQRLIIFRHFCGFFIGRICVLHMTVLDFTHHHHILCDGFVVIVGVGMVIGRHDAVDLGIQIFQRFA